MLLKDVFLWVILIITFLRGTVMRFRGNFDTHYLFISLFIVAAPFNFLWEVWQVAEKSTIRGRVVLAPLGRFAGAINVNIGLVVMAILIISGFFKLKKDSFSFKNNPWLYFLLLLCIVSYVNPYNTFNAAIFPMLAVILQFYLLFILIDANFDKATILKGVFDGLASLTLINLVLTICYPLLKMTSAAMLIYGQGALAGGALRREGYPSAVGVYDHPNTLAFSLIIPIMFFIGCYVKNYRSRKWVFFLIATNLFILFLTFSRSAYVGVALAIIISYFVYYRKLNLRLKKGVITGIIGVIAGIGLLFIYLVLYKNLLLFKDAGTMLNAREQHWTIGYEIWKNSPFLGVGLNTHVYYMSHHDFAYTGAVNTFTINASIHNVHVIILAEAGLIGILAWLCFIYLQFKGTATFKPAEESSSLIFKMTFFGILIGALYTGFFDHSPSNPEILPLILFFGYFANQQTAQKKLA